MHSHNKVLAATLTFALGTSLMAIPACLAQDGLYGQVSVAEDLPQEEIVAELPVAQLPMLAGLGGAAGIAPGKGLDLSIDQLEKLNSIKTATMEKSGPLKAELRTLKRQLKDQLTQETIERSKVKGLNSQINDLKAKLSEIRIASAMDSHDVFTPEQKQLMRKHSLERQLKGHKMRNHCAKMGPGGGHRRMQGRFGPPQGNRAI